MMIILIIIIIIVIAVVIMQILNEVKFTLLRAPQLRIRSFSSSNHMSFTANRIHEDEDEKEEEDEDEDTEDDGVDVLSF